MKKHMQLCMAVLCLMLVLTGCRTRITANESADETLYDKNTEQIETKQPDEQIEPEESTQPSAKPGTVAAKNDSKPKDTPKDTPEDTSQDTPKDTPKDNSDDNNAEEPDDIDDDSGAEEPDGGDGGNDGNGGSGNGGSGGSGDGGSGIEIPKEKDILVTLNANGGRCSPASKRSIMVAQGGTYEGLPEATRGGYTFAGWYTEPDGGTYVDESTVVKQAQAHTLYAHWTTRELHTVTFDTNGGWMNTSLASRRVYVGQTYGTEFPKPYNKTGYTFKGWYTAKSGGQKVEYTDRFDEHSDQVLYAQWNYDPYVYWSGVLNNTNPYECQIQTVYIEYDKDNVTTQYSTLVAMTGSKNAGITLSDTNITDEQIRDMSVNVVVKCVKKMNKAESYYNSMKSRLPGKQIIVVPSVAEWGSSKEMTYYALYLKKLIYPDAMASVDMDLAGKELGINGYVYTR